MITYQIVEHLQNDSLVVADLTGRNPNVFYEIGIRHTVGKPIIHMHAAGEVLPFDVQAFRSIPYDLQWPQDIVEAKQHLEKQVLETEQQGYVSRSPVQMFTDIISAGSTKPSDEKILRELADLALRIRSLEDQSRRHASPKALAAALLDRPEHSLSTSDSNAIIDILSKVPVRPLRISDSAMDEFLEFQRKRDSDPID